MSGRSRLPSGSPRKASHSRQGEAPVGRIEIPWQPGDRVRWRDRAGTYRRDTGDGEHVEIAMPTWEARLGNETAPTPLRSTALPPCPGRQLALNHYWLTLVSAVERQLLGWVTGAFLLSRLSGLVLQLGTVPAWEGH